MSTHHIFADPDNVNILEAAVTPPGENCVCEESLVHILWVTQSIADNSHHRQWCPFFELVYFFKLVYFF